MKIKIFEEPFSFSIKQGGTSLVSRPEITAYFNLTDNDKGTIINPSGQEFQYSNKSVQWSKQVGKTKVAQKEINKRT